MSTEQTDELSPHWFSTYGFITAERILGRFHVSLSQAELRHIFYNTQSFYHHLLQVPLKNVFNGIIFEQADDCFVYVQKLFVDYLLSGESSKNEETQGSMTRQALEEERLQLIAQGEAFQEQRFAHETLIAHSQAFLFQLMQEWRHIFEQSLKKVRNTLKEGGLDLKKSLLSKALNHVLISTDWPSAGRYNEVIFLDGFSQKLSFTLSEEIKKQLVVDVAELESFLSNFTSKSEEFVEQTLQVAHQAQYYRNLFYETIIRVGELMRSLPDYKIDEAQDAINRESLYFDKSIATSS